MKVKTILGIIILCVIVAKVPVMSALAVKAVLAGTGVFLATVLPPDQGH